LHSFHNKPDPTQHLRATSFRSVRTSSHRIRRRLIHSSSSVLIWSVRSIWRNIAGELLGLRWKDCDFENRRFTISNTVWRGQLQTTKTEASDRTIGIPEPLVRTLSTHREETKHKAPDDFVFCQEDGKPIDPDSLRRLGIYPAREKAKIPFQKRASGCHAFRRFVASAIHKHTGSLKLAQQQLGHSNVSTTANIYTAVDDEQVTETADALGKVFCGRSVVETLSVSSLVN
jgi:integrase